jgi:hypothetical protein
VPLDHLHVLLAHLVDRNLDDDAVGLVQADLVAVETEVFRLDLELARFVAPYADTAGIGFC